MGDSDRRPDVNRRILVVEDEEIVRFAYARILGATDRGDRGDGFQVDFATDGHRAVELARRAARDGRPHAVAFVDLQLNDGRDGLDAIARLREVVPDVEFVLCTSFAQRLDEDALRRLGSGDRLLILKKPFERLEILQLASALTTKWALARRDRERRERLEELVEERTRELHRAHQWLLDVNEELRAARDVAESANRAKLAFLANTSHELRTPLTSILGFTELALRELDESHAAAAPVHVVERNARHLLTIVNDLLDVSRIEAGRLALHPEACRVRDLVNEVAVVERSAAEAKGLALDVAIDSEVPDEVAGDPLRLRQILFNLLDNAVRFTDEGTVRVRGRVDDRERLVLDVTDTGPGIPPEHAESVFEMFRQGSAGISRTHGGTGLGLAICRQLARMHGGDVVLAENAPGRGSTFRLWMPIAEAPRREATAADEADASPEESLPPGFRVLIAEDAPDTQRLLDYFARHEGTEPVVVGTGREAVDEALAAWRSGRPFAVVLMDVQMPVLDGYAATRELREAGYPGPIVALTAHAMQGERDLGLAAGCDAHAAKPIDHRRFAELLRRFAADPAPATSVAESDGPTGAI